MCMNDVVGIILGGGACAALAVTVFFQFRQDWRAWRLKIWIRKTHPEIWRALPFLYRRLLKPSFGVLVLHSSGRVTDAQFNARVACVKADERISWIWLTITVSLFGALFLFAYLN